MIAIHIATAAYLSVALFKLWRLSGLQPAAHNAAVRAHFRAAGSASTTYIVSSWFFFAVLNTVLAFLWPLLAHHERRDFWAPYNTFSVIRAVYTTVHNVHRR